MRCRRCDFENPPGESRCFRCGSILEGGTVAAGVYPPRMAQWRRPFRGLVRWARARFLSHSVAPSMPRRWSLEDAVADGTVGLLLSIVPGLAHLIAGRFKQIWGWWLLWLVAVAGGVFIYGSVWAFPLLGLAIALHAWIAASYGFWQTLETLGEKVLLLGFVMLVLSVAYRIPSWATGISCVPSSLTIPYYQVMEGDYLVIRRLSPWAAPLARGTLVQYKAAVYQGRRDAFAQPTSTGQIVGLPGETVVLRGNAFEVGGRVLPPGRFPVPRWLQGRQATVPVPGNSYFVSASYWVQGHGFGGVVDERVIREMTVVLRSDVKAAAFMRWWPLWRRGWLEVD